MLSTKDMQFVRLDDCKPGDLVFSKSGDELRKLFYCRVADTLRVTELSLSGFRAQSAAALAKLSFKRIGLNVRDLVRVDPLKGYTDNTKDPTPGDLIYDGSKWALALTFAEDLSYVDLSGVEVDVFGKSLLVFPSWGLTVTNADGTEESLFKR
jgi:hypothetical protein